MAAFLCYYAKDETTVLVPMLQGKVEKEPLLETREGIFSAKKYLTLYNRRYILITESEVSRMAVCKGCKKRKVGCKKTCLEYVVETIVNQPEKEKEEKARKEAVAKYTDKAVRLNRTKTSRMGNKAVFKSTKKGVAHD